MKKYLFASFLINLSLVFAVNAKQTDVSIGKPDLCEGSYSLSVKTGDLYRVELNNICIKEEIAAKKYSNSKAELDKLLKEVNLQGPKNIFYKPTTTAEYVDWAKNHLEKNFNADTICKSAGFKEYKSFDNLLYVNDDNLSDVISTAAHSLVYYKHDKFIKSFIKLFPYCFLGIETREVRNESGRKSFVDSIVPIVVDRAEAKAAIDRIISSVKIKISGEFSKNLSISNGELKNNFNELLEVHKNISSLKGLILETEEAFSKGYNSREDLIQSKQWGAKSLDEFKIFKMAQDFRANRLTMGKIYEFQINSNEKYTEILNEILSIKYSNSTVLTAEEILEFLVDKREANNRKIGVIDYKNQRIAMVAKEKEYWALRQKQVAEAQIERERLERINYVKEFPYEAIIDCEWGGRSVRDLRLCLIGDGNFYTEIYVNNNGIDPKIYNLSNVSSLTRQNQGVAKIPLRNRFELRAQNADSSRTMIVTIIETKSGAVLKKEALGFRKSLSIRD